MPATPAARIAADAAFLATRAMFDPPLNSEDFFDFFAALALAGFLAFDAFDLVVRAFDAFDLVARRLVDGLDFLRFAGFLMALSRCGSILRH
jgi:hypothetical protein